MVFQKSAGHFVVIVNFVILRVGKKLLPWQCLKCYFATFPSHTHTGAGHLSRLLQRGGSGLPWTEWGYPHFTHSLILLFPRAFTPELAKWYNSFKKTDKGEQFEVVFVSSDKDEDSYKEYFKDMPWLALPYNEREAKVRTDKEFR